MAKESIIPRDNNVTLVETFNSFNDIAKNWGIVRGTPTIENWIMTLNWTTDAVTYVNNPWGLAYAFCVKFNSPVAISKDLTTEMVVMNIDGFEWYAFNGITLWAWTAALANEIVGLWYGSLIRTWWVGNDILAANEDHTIVCNWNWSYYDIWVDWDKKTVVNSGWGVPLYDADAVVMWASWGWVDTYDFIGDIELARIRDKAYSDTEINALFDNSLYIEPPVQTPDGKEVLSIDPSIWSVVDKFWTPLNTNVETIKDESYMMDFNGSNTKLYYGSSPIWSNPPQLSIAIWVQSNIKPVGTDDYYLGFPKDESGWQTGLIFYCDTSWNLKIAYNWTSSKYIGTTTSYVWKTTCVWFTYDVVGWGKIYIDWELIDSDIAVGALNLTEDELTVGNFWTTYSRFFDWLIGKIRMNTAIRTAEDHARFYNATKHLYNK